MIACTRPCLIIKVWYLMQVKPFSMTWQFKVGYGPLEFALVLSTACMLFFFWLKVLNVIQDAQVHFDTGRHIQKTSISLFVGGQDGVYNMFVGGQPVRLFGFTSSEVMDMLLEAQADLVTWPSRCDVGSHFEMSGRCAIRIGYDEINICISLYYIYTCTCGPGMILGYMDFLMLLIISFTEVTRMVKWPCHSTNFKTKLGRDPSKRTAQTKELRDKEGKRALDHAGKAASVCGNLFFGGFCVRFFLKLALRTWRNSQESCSFWGSQEFSWDPKAANQEWIMGRGLLSILAACLSRVSHWRLWWGSTKWHASYRVLVF